MAPFVLPARIIPRREPLIQNSTDFSLTSRREPPLEILNKPELCQRFNELFGGSDLRILYKILFKMRGALHHAKNRGPDAWHPDHQSPFRFEAIIFAELASNVLFSNVVEVLGREEVIGKYREMFPHLSS